MVTFEGLRAHEIVHTRLPVSLYHVANNHDTHRYVRTVHLLNYMYSMHACIHVCIWRPGHTNWNAHLKMVFVHTHRVHPELLISHPHLFGSTECLGVPVTAGNLVGNVWNGR